MPHRIGSLLFRTKKEITRHVQALFDKYSTVGMIVTDEPDHEFLLALLQRHEECDEKLGSGVSHFSRDTHPTWHSPGFKLHRIDGSSTDFSTSHCIAARGPGLMARFREACKYAVDDILRDHKFRMFDLGGGTVVCPTSGARLGKDQCRLEQTAPSWKELVDDFVRQSGHTITELDITTSQDNQYWHELTSAQMVSAFRGYYSTRVNLVPKRINHTRRSGG